MDPTGNPATKTAEIVSLEEVRARRTLKGFHARVRRLRESVSDLRRIADCEAPLLAFRRDPPR